MLVNLKLYAICGAVIIALVSLSYVYLSYRIECEVKDRYERKLQEFRAEELQNLLDQVFSNWEIIKSSTQEQQYDIPRENRISDLKTNVVTFVARK